MEKYPLRAYEFLKDHHIPIAGERDRHYMNGWVNTRCPFCSGNEGNHLGYNTMENYWHCWRCGWKSSLHVTKTLLKMSTREAIEVLRKYRGRAPRIGRETGERAKAVDWPVGCGEVQAPHLKYLKRRGFSPKSTTFMWGLKGTGPIGPFKFRIIAPIYHRNKRLVSYQGRDITEKSEKKYLPCPKELEVFPHKHTLYGIHLIPPEQRTVVVVEGITDVWRLGPGAVATFGTSITQPQLYLLSKFDNVWIVFDNEEEAQEKAETLGNSLVDLISSVNILEVDTDPADIPQDEADDMMSTMLGIEREL